MRWVAKAIVQKGLGALPNPERVNYVLQRHVTHSLPAPERTLRRKFRRAVQHLKTYERFGPDHPLGEAVFYEFGAGWDLAVPLSFWALGVDRQILVDVRPNLHLSLVNVTLERLARLGPELGQEVGRELRIPRSAPLRPFAELEERFGISYLAPCDARRTGLDSGSVDFVSSTSTLEHVPHAELVPLLAESRRLLRAGGILSAVIDISDHYARFDPSVSPYNFLRYSDPVWSLVNSRLQHQNRLRRPEYRDAFRTAGLEVVWEKAWRPPDAELAPLRALKPAERFRTYSTKELAVQTLRLVARPAVAPSPDALEELAHIGG
jgi:SAM-dependent methyltransferase